MFEVEIVRYSFPVTAILKQQNYIFLLQIRRVLTNQKFFLTFFAQLYLSTIFTLTIPLPLKLFKFIIKNPIFRKFLYE